MNLCYKGKETKNIKRIERICTELTFPLCGTIGGKVMHKMLENKCRKKMMGK